MEHKLKTDPDVFQAVWKGLKNFEIRWDDREFKLGDTLVLKETLLSGEAMKAGYSLEYTGREIQCQVTHILQGGIYGLMDGWVIMSIKTILLCEDF